MEIGRDLILLHGAICSANCFKDLTEKLQQKYIVHTPNFSGHGGAPMAEFFSIEQFASEVLNYLSEKNIDQIDIFGYSMGGYVALYLAKMHPERVRRIFTLGTKFEWTPAIAEREVKMLNADEIAEKIPTFAQQLEKRHAPNDWKVLLGKTAEMMMALGHKNPLLLEDYRYILNSVRIAIGDKDQVVTLEETIAVYRNLPNATFMVLPNTPHPIAKTDMEKLSREIKDFFN